MKKTDQRRLVNWRMKIICHAAGFNLLDELRDLVERQLDAIWVRARIAALFGIDSPQESERPEKSLMAFGFVAVSAASIRPRPVAFPFECTGYYGRSSLFFSESEPDEATRRTIGSAFWDLLLPIRKRSRTTRTERTTSAQESGWTVVGGTAPSFMRNEMTKVGVDQSLQRTCGELL